MSSSFVVDASVLAEYLDEESPYRGVLERFFADVRSKRIRAYVTPVTIAEPVLVAIRIYREAGIKNVNEEARKCVLWLTNAAVSKLLT